MGMADATFPNMVRWLRESVSVLTFLTEAKRIISELLRKF